MRYAILIIVLLLCGCAEEPHSVSISFQAMVGDQAFACGEAFDGLGDAAGGASLTPMDLRFYIHDVRLVHEDGEELPIALNNDGKYQNGEVALLDFESGCGDVGDSDTHTTLEGNVPRPGPYTSIRFQVGVPEALNHGDPSLAEPPLSLTGMWWTWNAGYKFIRIDARSSEFDGWRLHLGSTQCEGDMRGNATCDVSNRPQVDLSGDPTTAPIVVDLAALVADSPLTNTPDSPPGCMSTGDDPDCEPLFSNLGLRNEPQSFFRF